MFPLRSFPSITRTMFYGAWPVGKRTVRWSPKYWIYFKNNFQTNSLPLPFCHSSFQIQCPSLYINKALLLNSFLKISICISCTQLEVNCSWYLRSLPSPFTYFLISGYLLRNPDKSNFFRFARRFEFSESTVLYPILRRWKWKKHVSSNSHGTFWAWSFRKLKTFFYRKRGHAFICTMDSQCVMAGNSMSIFDTFLMNSKKHLNNLQCIEAIVSF